MFRLILLVQFLSLSLNLFSTEDSGKLFEKARKSWLDGRTEDASETYKYLIYISTGDRELLSASRDLTVLLNETGQNSLAKIYADKAQAIVKDDPWLEFEKAWALLSLKKFPEAKKSFENVLTMTTDQDLIYNSRFMQAMTEMQLAGPLKAIEEFQTVYQKYPHLLSASSYMIALCYDEMKNRNFSINFFKETLQYDQSNIQALIKLAQTYDKVGHYLPAWQSYYTLAELDSDDIFFQKKEKKLSAYLKNAPDNLLYWTRLAWPMHAEPLKIQGRKKIRIGLYTSKEGELSAIRKFYFISNSDFSIIDSKLGKTYSGKKNSQYEAVYEEKDRIFNIKDNSSSKIYTTRQNFSLKTDTSEGVILIKNPEIPVSIKGINRSDKEVSNELSVKISTQGMTLVNHTYIEHILPSMISVQDLPGDAIEAFKAFSVVMRTELEKHISSPFSEEYDICDNPRCLDFRGLQSESEQAVKAAAGTGGEILKKDGATASVTFHNSCGGGTERGADDDSLKPASFTPFILNKWVMSAPSQKLYCLPEDSTLFSRVSWTILIDPYWIEERVNSKYRIGKIKNITVLKRSKFGEVLSILVKGTANDAEIEGGENVSWALSGGTLRSRLFTIRPLMYGNYPQYFLIRGKGTGDLKDFCLMGAYGMAKNLGYKYDAILLHYFPDLKFKKELPPQPKKKAPVKKQKNKK